MEIRLATIDDAKAIRRIYEPYVINTAITFEYDVPTVEEFEARIQKTLEKYPYLVLLEDGNIVGYAYAGTFYPRAAYMHSAELSVYVDMNCHGRGYGRALYNRLQELLLQQRVYTVHACIASPDEEDEHLTADSESFHEHMGFKLAGRHEKCGYKFGKWYSIVWMDKLLADRPDNPDDFVPFPEISRDFSYK